MGKRVATAPSELHHNGTATTTIRSIRKRKPNSKNYSNTVNGVSTAASAKNSQLFANTNGWHENDDEDSSSNDTTSASTSNRRPAAHNQSNKHGNNSSILLNTSIGGVGFGDTTLVNESPKPVYTLHPSVVNGTIMHDLTKKPWRLGRPIGKGNFGEIFLASDNIALPVTNDNAKFVVKIEPHSNGPLFVEIHCLMNTAKKTSDNDELLKEEGKDKKPLPLEPPSGIPEYIASGSHYFGDARYRFLVLQRFDRDLHSLIRNTRVQQKSVLTLAIQIIKVLENLHDKGYCHNDVKAQNLMISKCTYYQQQQQQLCSTDGKSRRNQTTTSIKSSSSSSSNNNNNKYKDHFEEKQQTTDSGNSSEQEGNDDEDSSFVIKKQRQQQQQQRYDDDGEEDEDFDDGATTNSNNSNSTDMYKTPINHNRKRRRPIPVEYSGSNPVRSCRRQKRNAIYEEMVNSHYLRPTKRVSYSEFFQEDGVSWKDDMCDITSETSDDDESEEFIPHSVRRTTTTTTPKKTSLNSTSNNGIKSKRLTKRQEKLLAKANVINNNGGSSSATKPPTRGIALNELIAIDEERIYLIDYGLASKYMDNGLHRPFVMDQRRAHDGTLEFTSRDAHMGAHSRRSDLECLGYNLLFWSQGYLPWREAAAQHQQEKVHRAKEYLMTDVREMLKQIYGKQVPKYLGEFLYQVGQLAHHERPNYASYRRIFEHEFKQLNYPANEMRLISGEILRTGVRISEEIENKNDLLELTKPNNVLSIMKNISVGTPFHERTISNRVSPKNLRSKSDKKTLKKKKSSWAEILSQDPDQIARERAEKEYERAEQLLAEVQQRPTVRRYMGKPTYAILEIQRRMKLKGRLVEENSNDQVSEDGMETEECEEDNDGDEEYEEEDENDEDMKEDVSVEESNEEEEEDEDDDEDDEDDEDEDEEEESEQQTDSEEEEEEDNSSNRRLKRSKPSVVAKSTAQKKRQLSNNNNIQTARVRTRGISKQQKIKTTTTTTTIKPNSNNTNKTSNIINQKKKRGSATRISRKSSASAAVLTAQLASAAGEEVHCTTRYLDNDNLHNKRVVDDSNNGGGGGGVVPKTRKRRARRCLIKTDTSVVDDDDDDDEEEEEGSNSRYSPDVRKLFNVWKKINNETIYYKGGATATAGASGRHYKK